MSKGGKGGGNSVPPAVHNQNSQQTNGNWGTSGTNSHWDKAMGHRGWQMNPENPNWSCEEDDED